MQDARFWDDEQTARFPLQTAAGNQKPRALAIVYLLLEARGKMQDFGMMTKQLVPLCKQQPEIKSHGLWQLLAVNVNILHLLSSIRQSVC
jgi:hypothetical protein